MGPLPATPGCDCQVCRPGGPYDENESSCIAHVLQTGWEVILVGSDGDADGAPMFGYTVGLGHRTAHPELLISGQSPELVHHALNTVAQRVLAGTVLQPGDGIEGVFGHVPLIAEEIVSTAREHTVTWASWFARASSPALQLVWPDSLGRFAWQPGASPELERRQPSTWRLPSARAGGFAIDPEWVHPVPAETSVLICTHVAAGDAVCVAAHEPGETPGTRGEWTFHCGAEHGEWTSDQLCGIHLAHVVRCAPSVRSLADLPIGWFAERAAPDQPWQRSPFS